MQEFGFKELYDVVIKTTYPIEINNKQLEVGEVIAYFDSINISNFQEIKNLVSAKGGYNNESHVWWDSTKEVDFSFSKGIFSKTQLALLINSKIVTRNSNIKPIIIHNRELKESDENCLIILDKSPCSKIFVYDEATGDKVNYTSIDNNTIQLCCPYTNVIIDYDYRYENQATELMIGRQFTNGYLELQGKTKIKEEGSGRVKTGIIHIPKLKLVSNLTMRLGDDASPIMTNFEAIGCPVGEKGKRTFMEIYFLDENIDSDM